MTVAMRAFPLVGGPVELRGALDLEETQAGVMPRRLPAWTKEQYQDPSVHGPTVMPSGVRLVFRTMRVSWSSRYSPPQGSSTPTPTLARPGCWNCWWTAPTPGAGKHLWAM